MSFQPIMKRYLFPLLLLLMATPSAHSQEPDSVSHPFTLTGYGLYDFHYATDGIGGGALIPLLVGAMKDWVGPQPAYWICLPFYLLIMYYAYYGYKIRR